MYNMLQNVLDKKYKLFKIIIFDLPNALFETAIDAL